ncbi:TadE/TadG family type IV pilus assembly protein [Roseinatronobacter alkalisoli]|uniref:Pilus assembly protein n=1 Tax=Roseinatronobacter alkalisoli TaxID=3028235 RepID=A0ABT5T8B0_9RHOB|nr:TadE/TadG family type IV pilus assembly protein [Roseinatronobacter sp. HJB301]MDD7971366.1 pilus assembly protein [Roseinatronobacter sp. HJB301]
MTRTSRPVHWLRRFRRNDDGAATVEFVILFPLVLALMLGAIDLGITMVRQVMLDRAVDITVRDVRLGKIGANGSARMSDLICANSMLLPDCIGNISVEMMPVNTSDFTGLDGPFTCIDSEQEITPAVTFNPGMGGAAQELMLLRICVVAEPFLRVTGLFSGLDINPEGQLVLTSRSAFVNEPR